MLLFSVAVHEFVGESKPSLIDDKQMKVMKNLSAPHRRLLVKYDTLIQYGAVVYSKPGVDTYSTILIDAVERKEWKEGIYVGARNWLVKFDLSLNETEAVEIPPSAEEIENCQKTNPTDDCHNFIKHIHVLGVFGVGRIDVCGTFAHSPACSGRFATELSKEAIRIPGLSTNNPRGSVAAHVSGSHLFLGLVDPKTETPAILMTTLAKGSPIFRTIENKGWLNQAEFVGAFSTSKEDKFVYIVFWEVAIEAPIKDVIYSRVARICKDERGWTGGVHQNALGSFIKARLDCGIEHSKVQSISYVENDGYFWATFISDRKNGTAICGFNIIAMESVFRGPYLHRDEQSHKWEQVPPPYFHEGDSTTDTCFGLRSAEAVLNYTMMGNVLHQYCSVFVDDALLTKLAVSSSEQDAFTAFAGDDQGRVWKIGLTTGDVFGDVHVWEVVPANETSKEINGVAVHNNSVIVLTNNAVWKVLSQREYPGEIIYARTTFVTRSPSLRTSPATKAQTAKTTKSTEGNPNNSHSRFNFSFSLTTMLMIATGITDSCRRGIQSNK